MLVSAHFICVSISRFTPYLLQRMDDKRTWYIRMNFRSIQSFNPHSHAPSHAHPPLEATACRPPVEMRLRKVD